MREKGEHASLSPEDIDRVCDRLIARLGLENLGGLPSKTAFFYTILNDAFA